MKSNKEYIFICNENELKESEGKRFYVNDTDIAVFKIGGKIFLSAIFVHISKRQKFFRVLLKMNV